MLCPNCKNEQKDTATFCSVCGVNMPELLAPPKKLGRLGFIYKKPSSKCLTFNIVSWVIAIICIILTITSNANILVGDLTETFALDIAQETMGNQADLDRYLDDLGDFIDDAEDALNENKDKIKRDAYKDAKDLIKKAKELEKMPSVNNLRAVTDTYEELFGEHGFDAKKSGLDLNYDTSALTSELEDLVDIVKILSIIIICYIILLVVIFILAAIFKNTALAVLGTILATLTGVFFSNILTGTLLLATCITLIVFTALVNKEYKAYSKAE